MIAVLLHTSGYYWFLVLYTVVELVNMSCKKCVIYRKCAF
jgi:hypothetical protein